MSSNADTNSQVEAEMHGARLPPPPASVKGAWTYTKAMIEIKAKAPRWL